MTFKRVSNITALSGLSSCAFVLASVITASCGGGGNSPASKFNVGGSVTGLAGAGLVLANNGTDTVAVSADGSFKFGTQMQSGQNYAVTVKSEPANPTQVCVVTNGAGTMASGDITNIGVTCTTQAFPIGVAVNGLAGSGLVLQNNGTDDLAVAASGQVRFSGAVASGDPYNVTVKTQPSNPAQICNVTGGSGTVTAGPVIGVVVGCDTLSLSLLAGHLGGLGNIDGSGTGARFNQPYGPGIDGAGNLYVADWNPSIRKVTPAGIVSTLPGANPQFDFPSDVAVDGAGNLYVADSGRNIIRKITPAGTVTNFAGSGSPGSADGQGSAASFNNPGGVAVDAAGNVYVADTYNCTLRRITPTGTVTTVAGIVGMQGSADGPAATATFSALSSVAVDTAGNVFIADPFNNTIRKLALGVVSTLAGTAGVSGGADGTGAAAQFNHPSGVAVDAVGTIYVADTANHTVRRVTAAGIVTTLAGTAGASGATDGAGSAARFSSPVGVRVDAGGTIYVADNGNSAIRKVTASGVVTTFAGAPASPGSADQTGAAASFSTPYGIAADAAGDIYVADFQNSTIRKVTPAGAVTTLAGSPGVTGSADGTGSAARFSRPQGLGVDAHGTVYVADTDNFTIRAITAAGVVTTLAGSPGTRGTFDGVGSAAQFLGPTAVVVDPAGTLYVADGGSIRKIAMPSGSVTTLVSQKFMVLSSLALDASGNLYASDWQASTISKVTPAGVVTTLAGTALQYGWADGTGPAARFDVPEGIAVDSAGNVYVADLGNQVIRKITSAGVVTTIVGVPFEQGVVLGALPASLNRPYGVSLLPGQPVSLAISSQAENAILRAGLP
jgi:sugar lactone lactonase YvrE